ASEGIQHPLAMNFGRYHYGMMREMATNVEDMVGRWRGDDKASMSERVEAVGKALAMVGAGIGLMPLANLALQKAFNNARVEFRTPGSLGPVMAAIGFIKGDKDYMAFTSSIFGLSPIVSLANAFATGRDEWGRPVLDAATPLGKIIAGLEYLGDKVN